MISTISLNFHRVDLSVRSVLQYSQDELTAIYRGLKGRPGLNGLLILNTCNRTEVYIDHETWFDIRVLLCYLQQAKDARIPFSQFDLIEDTPSAIQYIVEVGNGLHSMVTGDKQILSQLKDAFRLSQAEQMISGMLERIFQLLIRSHKRIANETGYHSGSSSISHLAIREMKQRSANKDSPVLVIGAGQIAADMVKYLSANNYSDVTVMNRTAERSQVLATQYSFKYQPYGLNPLVFDRYDVIISCAGVADLLSREMQKAMSGKLLIDLTIDQSISKVPDGSNVLVTLDELGMKRNEDMGLRAIEIEQARSIISQEHAGFMEWMRQREIRHRKNLMMA